LISLKFVNNFQNIAIFIKKIYVLCLTSLKIYYVATTDKNIICQPCDL
jgi:hypothetical protein